MRRPVLARRPLRVTLVVLVVSLTAVGLLVAGLVATALLRGYLTDRIDEQLRETAGPLARAPISGLRQDALTDPPQGGPGAPPVPMLPGRFYVQAVSASGGDAWVVSAPRTPDGRVPVLPTPTIEQARAGAGVVTTVPSQGGGPGWRAVVVPLADGSGSLTVAASLADVEATVGRLALLQVVVGSVVLLLVAGSAYLLVRRSLRPLVDVEQVAGQIAAGDLTRRVPGADGRTEVGQLAGAFNTMVERIERSFEAQAASEAAARESEARMRRFVADAGHELRTPLTSIRGYAELYRQGAVAQPAELDRAMGRIEDEATRMGLLVDDLLLLARLDRQRPLELSPVDLLAVAADVVHDASRLGSGRPVGLTAVDGGWPPVVLGDAARLRQVVSNLVGNAVRHTPEGTRVEVRVQVEGTAGSPGARVVLEVADDGPGLGPESAARVFERFYRADPARSRDDGGTGLGLSIVAALVQAHGGEVSVESAPGLGATFRVSLPAAPGASAS